MIRRELPRTEDADWVMRPYRTKGGRILLSVNPGRVTRTVPSEPDVLCQNKACHSLLVEEGVWHRRRAQSRPSAASRRVAWTGGRDAISSETREWQRARSRPRLQRSSPHRPASIRTFLKLHRLCASWGPQILRVLQSKCRPGHLRVPCHAAPVRTLRAVTRTRRAFPKLNLSSCRYCFAVPADMQRFVNFSADPQLMQEHGQFSRDRHQCPLLCVLPAARG
jgi:hypothetical protein